jgi:hypothetical protein
MIARESLNFSLESPQGFQKPACAQVTLMSHGFRKGNSHMTTTASTAPATGGTSGIERATSRKWAQLGFTFWLSDAVRSAAGYRAQSSRSMEAAPRSDGQMTKYAPALDPQFRTVEGKPQCQAFRDDSTSSRNHLSPELGYTPRQRRQAKGCVEPRPEPCEL